MINTKSVIAVIPARKGSKGLPGKNIKNLCSKPLIQWSIESALESKLLDRIVLTTDCEDIAELGNRLGAMVPFLRPSELATDTATSVDVVLHTLDFMEREHGEFFDYVVLLEPTSPLRKKNDIDQMILKLNSSRDNYDGIVSVGEVKENPTILKSIDGDNLLPYDVEKASQGRRQDNSPVYFPYGVAYIVDVSIFKREKSFYPNRLTYYLIDHLQRFEIDDLNDFLIVELLMKNFGSSL